MDGKIEHTKELTTKEVCNIVACSYFHSQGDGGAQSLMLIYIADRMFEDGNSLPPFEKIHLRDLHSEMERQLSFKAHQEVHIDLGTDALKYCKELYEYYNERKTLNTKQLNDGEAMFMFKLLLSKDSKFFQKRLADFHSDPSAGNEPSFLYAFGILKRTIPSDQSTRKYFAALYKEAIETLTASDNTEFKNLLTKAAQVPRTKKAQ